MIGRQKLPLSAVGGTGLRATSRVERLAKCDILQRMNLSAFWWRKICNLGYDSALKRIVRRKPKLVVTEIRPVRLGYGEVLFQNGFDSRLVQAQIPDSGFKSGQIGAWGTMSDPMQHEGGGFTGLSDFGPKEDRDGC